MALWGAKNIVKVPAPSKTFGGTGVTGEHVPTGQSVAASQVSQARAKPRAIPGAPKPKTRMPVGNQRRNPPHLPPPKKPQAYNALESPYKTVPQFNEAVKNITKAGYEPELQADKTEEEGEHGLNAAREGSNVDIFNKAHAAAQQGFETAKSTMSEIAARQNSSTSAGQAALQAALSNTGVSGLGSVGNQDSFMNEAAGLGNAGSQSLAGDQSGLATELGVDEGIPGAGLAESQQAEQQRDQSALNKIAKGRATTLAGIPAAEAKTREGLENSEVNRETANLQNNIANRKLGLEKTTQAASNAREKEKVASSDKQAREANAQKNHELAVSSGFESTKLKLQGEEINAKIAEAKNGAAKAAAELEGKRFDHGLEGMAAFFKGVAPGHYIDNGNATYENEEKAKGLVPEPAKSPEALYKTLTEQYNLNAPEAFRLMASSNNAGVEAWAHLHNRKYEASLDVGKNKKGTKINLVHPRHG